MSKYFFWKCTLYGIYTPPQEKKTFRIASHGHIVYPTASLNIFFGVICLSTYKSILDSGGWRQCLLTKEEKLLLRFPFFKPLLLFWLVVIVINIIINITPSSSSTLSFSLSSDKQTWMLACYFNHVVMARHGQEKS